MRTALSSGLEHGSTEAASNSTCKPREITKTRRGKVRSEEEEAIRGHSVTPSRTVRISCPSRSICDAQGRWRQLQRSAIGDVWRCRLVA